jgi:lysophospholipase L1-like esterase
MPSKVYTSVAAFAFAIIAIAALQQERKFLRAKSLDWQQVGTYGAQDKALPSDSERVIFFGDSITYRWGNSGMFRAKNYVDRGIPEQTTSQMLLRFRQDVIDLHPKEVVILAGTNDILQFNSPAAVSIAEDNIETMVDLAREHKIRVILCSLPPARHRVTLTLSKIDYSESIRSLNLWLKGYSAREGAAYVDYYSPLVGADGSMKPGLSLDGVHPTNQGYAVMEPLVRVAIDGHD